MGTSAPHRDFSLSPTEQGDWEEGSGDRFFAVWHLLRILQADIAAGLDIVSLIPILAEQATIREKEFGFWELDKFLTEKIGPLGSQKRRDHSAKRLKDVAPPLIEKGLSNREIAQRLEIIIGTRARTLRDQLSTLQKSGELPMQRKRHETLGKDTETVSQETA